MKFNVPRPPQSGGFDDIVSWLYLLTEQLNVVLQNLGVDNLNSNLKSAISKAEKLSDRSDTE